MRRSLELHCLPSCICRNPHAPLCSRTSYSSPSSSRVHFLLLLDALDGLNQLLQKELCILLSLLTFHCHNQIICSSRSMGRGMQWTLYVCL
jgi:hypothetical protein